MSVTLLEASSANHAEVERYRQKSQSDPTSSRDRLCQSHRVCSMMDQISDTTYKLIEIYEDKDSARKDEIAALGGQTASGTSVFSVLYDRLKEEVDRLFFEVHWHNFSDISYLVLNLAELGFKEPSSIQRQAIPVLLSRRECLACAPSGTGKILAFVCPMLIKLKHASAEGIWALILLPTRELAGQTARECKKLTRGTKFCTKMTAKQRAKSVDFSKLHCDILISTAYCVQYVSRKKKLDLSRNSASESIKQKLIFVGSEEEKLFAIRHSSFAESLNPQVLVFVQNKERAKELYNELKYDNIRADVIQMSYMLIYCKLRK